MGSKTYQGTMPYAPMKHKDLKVVPVHDIAEKNSVLLLWSTGPFLAQAITLITEWGFRFVTMFAVWRKGIFLSIKSIASSSLNVFF